MEFIWSERQYDLKTFVRKHSKNLPIIVRVVEGFCGLDDKDDYSFAADDEYRLTHLNKQPRVIVKDKIGRHISLPTSRPLRFCRIYQDDSRGPPTLLDDLVEVLDEGDKLVAHNNEKVDFWLSGDKKMATKLGTLEFVAQYQERFLVGNTICEGELLSEALVIPAYASIRIVLAEGLEDKTPEEFDILRQQLAIESRNFKNYKANGNLEIMLFEGKVTDYKDYDYLTPSNFLRVDASASSNVSQAIPPPPDKQHITNNTPKTPRTPVTGNSFNSTPSTKPEVGKPSGLPDSPPPLPGKPKPRPRKDSAISSPKAAVPPKIEKRSMKEKEQSGRPLPPLPPDPVQQDTEKKTTKSKFPSENQSWRTGPPLPPKNSGSAKPLLSPPDHGRRVEYQNNVGIASILTPQKDAKEKTPECDMYEIAVEAPSTIHTNPLTEPDDIEDDTGLYEEVHIDDDVVEEATSVSSTPVTSKPVMRSGSESAVKGSNGPEKHAYSRTNSEPAEVTGYTQEPYIPLPKRELTPSQQTMLEENLAVVRDKSVEEVCDLLDTLHLSKFKETFRENDIDGDLLVELNVSDLVNGLGFNSVQAKKLFKNITEAWRPK